MNLHASLQIIVFCKLFFGKYLKKKRVQMLKKFDEYLWGKKCKILSFLHISHQFTAHIIYNNANNNGKNCYSYNCYNFYRDIHRQKL